MNKTLTDLLKYIKYHFFEAEVINGSKWQYKLWAGKRIFKVLMHGRKKSESYLCNKDVTIKNREGLFFVPANTDLVLNISSKTEGHLIPYFSTEKGNTFLDIGANAGKWSIHIAKQFSENRIVAFEPIPATFDVLQKNIALNKIENQVTILNIGLSEENSTINFAGSNQFTGINRVFTEDISKLPEGFQLVKIPVRKLDDVISEKLVDPSKIELIKIDVEGHELAVLKGAVNTFKKLKVKTRLILEINIDSETRDDVFRLLSDLGFITKVQLDPINFLMEKTR